MESRRIFRLLIVPALVLFAASAARSAEFVVYYPDGPQDPSQMVAAFDPLQAEAKKSHALTLSGHYFVQLADFQKFVDSSKPGFGLVDAVYYLENKDKLGLESLAVAVDASDQGGQPYCLLVPGAKPWKTIDELKGKRLAVTPLASRLPYFVSDFLLESAFPMEHFAPQNVASAPSAVKALELGTADAAFVPCSQAPKGSAVRRVFTSRPVPYPVLVAFKTAAPADKDKMRALFLALPKTAKLVQTMQIGRFLQAPADYAKTLAGYRENPVPGFEDLRVSKAEGQAGSVAPSAILTPNYVEQMKPRFMPADPPE